jgi:hypothetical protein
MDVGALAFYSWFVGSMFTPCLPVRTRRGVSLVGALWALLSRRCCEFLEICTAKVASGWEPVVHNANFVDPSTQEELSPASQPYVDRPTCVRSPWAGTMGDARAYGCRMTRAKFA